MKQAVAVDVVGCLGQLLEGEQRRADQQKDDADITAQEGHQRVDAVKHIVHHRLFGIAVAMRVVKPDRQHRLQYGVGAGGGLVPYKQDVDGLGQPFGHRIRYNQGAAVIVADLVHIIGLLQRGIRAGGQRHAGDRQGRGAAQRFGQVAPGALVVAVEQVFIFIQRDRFAPLHHERAVEIRDRDDADRAFGQRGVDRPKLQVLPGEQVAVSQIGRIDRNLRHRLGIVGDRYVVGGQVGGDVSVAVPLNVRSDVEVVGRRGLGEFVHRQRGARSDRDRADCDGQQPADGRQNQIVCADLAADLPCQKSVEPAQVKPAVRLHDPQKD